MRRNLLLSGTERIGGELSSGRDGLGPKSPVTLNSVDEEKKNNNITWSYLTFLLEYTFWLLYKIDNSLL